MRVKTNQMFKFIFYLYFIALFLAPSSIFDKGIINIEFPNVFINNTIINLIDFLGLAILLIMMFYNDLKFQKNKYNLLVIVIILVFVTYIFTINIVLLPKSNSLMFSADFLMKLLRVLFIFYFTNFIIKNKIFALSDIRSFVSILLFILVLVSPIALNSFDWYSAGMNRTGTLGFPPNYLGFLGVFLFAYAMTSNHKFLVKVLFLALGTMGILMSGSRRGILVLGLYLVVHFIFYLFVYRKKNFNQKKNFVFFAIFMAIAAVVLILIFTGALDALSNIPLIDRLIRIKDSNSSIFSDDARIEIYMLSIETILKNPFGYGGSSIYLMQSIFPTLGHSHNLIFQFILMYGGLFGLILIFAMTMMVYKGIKAQDNNLFYFVSFLTISLLFDMFDYSLYSTKAIMVFVFFLSIVYNYTKTDKEKSRKLKIMSLQSQV